MFNNDWRLDQKNLLLRSGFQSAGVKVTSRRRLLCRLSVAAVPVKAPGRGRATLAVASSDARIREIGGKTVRFVLISPS